MKEQFKVSAIVFVIVFFAAMLFATFYIGGTANAFTQEELDECDRLFLAAVGETVDQSGEAGSFVANKRIVYDADLRELGIVYSYTSNSGNGYAVIVVQDEITVSEIVEGNDPYANLPGTPIYINQFTYAGYVDGNYVFENGATLTRAQINAYVGYHGAGTLTQTTRTVTYTSKTDNTYTAIKSSPSYNHVEEYSSDCTAVAAANIIGYYDRLKPELIPNYASYRAFGSNYTYKSQDATINSLIGTLYNDIGVNPATGASASKFRNGLSAYCNRQGATVSYTDVMSNQWLNCDAAKTFFMDEKPVVFFMERIVFETVSTSGNTDSYTSHSSGETHACVGFEYRLIEYTLSNGATSFTHLIKAATGISSIKKAYLNADTSTIVEAYGITIS